MRKVISDKWSVASGLRKVLCVSIFLISYFSFLIFTSCRQVPVVEVEAPKGDTLKENLINANRYISQGEEAQIDAYVARRGWQMTRLTGGARVMEVENGERRTESKKIDYEETVVIEYDIEAINGETVYRGVRDTVTVGRLQPTRGLDAALRTLHHGSQAVVILPSEQAYGVVGDGDRISTRMILVYKLRVES